MRIDNVILRTHDDGTRTVEFVIPDDSGEVAVLATLPPATGERMDALEAQAEATNARMDAAIALADQANATAQEVAQAMRDARPGKP